VVIGAGPNGLVAANILADAGWDVVVLEAQAVPGGAVRSGDYLGPGFVADFCSAFYPLATASPVIGSFSLQQFGLEWLHAPSVLAHPLLDGRCAVLSTDLERTASSCESLGDGDGAAWERLTGLWDRIGVELVDALFTPFPPVRAGVRLLRELHAAGGLRVARLAALPVRRLAEEEFTGPGSLLFAGCAMHADLAPESAGSALYGWLLAMLGQRHGWPVPKGGAASLTASLVRRLQARGGRVLCGRRVEEILVVDGAATGVRTEGGEIFGAGKGVFADVVAPVLYGGLVPWRHLPERLRDDMSRFQWDYSTVKVDWAVSTGVPWSAEGAYGAGTVHLGASMDELTQYCAELAMGRVPSQPFVLVGQMTTADPSRSPEGTESLWGYSHVPRQVRGDAGDGDIKGDWGSADLERFADRVEAQIERFAPGFRRRILRRHIFGPGELQAHNENEVGGAINGGTSALHQQLIFRPVPGLGRPETPVRRLYLASSSAHPGGGVHGACGANAARCALRKVAFDRWVLPGHLFAASRALPRIQEEAPKPGSF
jgi:phytoene dehydrogenase-like protein